ncbi:metal-dependent transcriptional regulator [bacterium]|nr:metal-dependent transcriptional regulator [bacterium]
MNETSTSSSVSPSAEEYLLTLFRKEVGNEQIGTSKLAELFDVKAPSVTGMLRRLHKRGWVTYKRYRPPELTDLGRSIATKLIRRHRLLETYLVSHLEFDPDEVHDEVEILEHAVSDTLIDRIDEKLGHPAFDPHGEPIPDENGHSPNMNLITLSTVAEESSAVFSRMDNRDLGMKKHLTSLGLQPGTNLTRMSSGQADQLLVKAGERLLKMPEKIAQLIWVWPDTY